MRMSFGRFRDRELCDLPDGYLQWLSSIELKEPLRGAVKAEAEARASHDLTLRIRASDAGPAERVFTCGFQALAARGLKREARRLNSLRDSLRAQLKGLGA